MLRRFMSLVLTVSLLVVGVFAAVPASASAATLQPVMPSSNNLNVQQIREPFGSTIGIGQALMPSEYYGRQRLVNMGDQRLVDIYDRLAEGVANYESSILLATEYYGMYGSGCVKQAEFMRVVTYYSFDHPETFWLKSYKFDREFHYDMLGNTYRDVTVVFEFTMTKDDILAKQAQLRDYSFNTLLPIKLDSKMSDYQREQFIFKTLHNSANVDKNQKLACARAFQYSMQRCGIQCLTIKGTYKGQEHAWNLVQFGNKWYAVDVAQNAMLKVLNPESSAYFNVNPSKLGEMGYTADLLFTDWDYLPAF